MKKTVLLALLALTGCAQSSGVVKMGPDTYSVSVHAAPARGGASGAKKLAVNEANAHCASMGKEIMVTNMTSGASSHLPGGTVDVTYMCLNSKDPDLQRPIYETPADVVIRGQ